MIESKRITSKELYGIGIGDFKLNLLEFKLSHTSDIARLAYQNAIKIDERIKNICQPFDKARTPPDIYCHFILACLNRLGTEEGSNNYNKTNKQMTSKILNLEQSNAIKAYKEGTPSDKLLLERLYGKEVFNLKITDRVKSFEDACEVLDINPYLPDVSLLEESLQSSVVATYKLQVIIKALNEGWSPNWNNSSEYKYYPWFNMRNNTLSFYTYAFWTANSGVSSHLCLRTRELVEYCGTQFIELYKQSFLL